MQTPDLLTSQVDSVPWDQFVTDFRWKQGEHVAIVGPTGCGKSTLAQFILPLRSHVVVMATKPMSPTLDKFKAQGYTHVKSWPKNLNPHRIPRVLLWPPLKDIDYTDFQEAVLQDAFGNIFHGQSWTVYIDECRWVSENLHQKRNIVTLLKQGRELDISMVIGDQRPVFLPRETWSQSTHLFFWRTNDQRDMENIGAIGGMSARLVAMEVAQLDQHEFLYINTRNRSMSRSQTPKPVGGGN